MTEKSPKEEHKNLAILFTDIVNSTEYFRKFGDEKGREMLRIHVENCKPEIERYKGTLLKTVGDSIMAYFEDPEDAIMAAISIQDRFEAIRRNTKEENRIHLRIGIHYGKVLYEKEDIFGDTVNYASRLTKFSDIDGILVSDTVKRAISGISGISFSEKKLDTSQKAYSLAWDKNNFPRPKKPVAIILDLATSDLEKRLPEVTINWLKNNPIIESIVTDGFFTIILPKGETKLLDFLSQLKAYLLESILKGTDVWTFKIAVDLSSSSSSTIPFSEMEPTGVYISEEAKRVLNEELSQPERVIIYGKRRFFEVSIPPCGIPEELVIKLKLNIASIYGGFCFYCGDPRHASKACPSKKLWNLSQRPERLKNLDSKKLNILLMDYLMGCPNLEDLEDTKWKESENPKMLLGSALFSIKRVFQLGFLRKILCFMGSSWEELLNQVSQEEGGGFLFLALDSLRVSDYRSFRKILDGYEPKREERFYLFCLEGFYFVENEKLERAKECFISALKCAVSQVEKVYALFLCMRVSYLLGDYEKAKRFSKEILQILKDSKEARYLDLLVSAREFKESERFKRRLINVISEDWDYFFYVIFDPELFSLSPYVHEAMRDFSGHVKEELDELKTQLRSIFELSHKFLLDEEIEEFGRRMDELEKKESDNYTDLFEKRGKIKALWDSINTLVKERMAEKSRILFSLKDRLENQLRCIESFPYPFLVGKTKKRISVAMDRLKEAQEQESYEAIKRMLRGLDEEVLKIDRELERALTTAYFFKGLTTFLKAFLILCIVLFLSELSFRYFFGEKIGDLFLYEPKSHKIVVFVISFLASLGFAIRSLRKIKI